MCEVLIDAHKCINASQWAYEIKDNLTLTMIADQISVLAGAKVLAVAWETPRNVDAGTWCRLYARFPTQESAMEFMLKWQ